jgi:hypothetical protein
LAETKFPVRATARAIWRDTPRILAAHPLLWSLCLLLNAAIHYLDVSFTEAPSLISNIGPAWQGFLADAARTLLPWLVVIPAAIATHRTIILGVVERPAQIFANRQRMVRYAIVEGLLFIAITGLTLLTLPFIRWVDASPDSEVRMVLATGAVLVLILLMSILILRAAASFPAVAVSDNWGSVRAGWLALRGQILALIGLVLTTVVGLVMAIVIGPLLLTVPFPDLQWLSEFVIRYLSLAAFPILAFGWVLTMSHIYKAVIGVPAESQHAG